MLDIYKILQESSLHLLNRLQSISPKQILLFGGSEVDKEILSACWSEADITTADIHSIPTFEKFDLVFSNNYIQHMTEQTALIGNLYALLNEGGALAIQTPNALNMPVHINMESIARDRKFRKHFVAIIANYFIPKYYYEALCGLTNKIDIWETNHQYIVEELAQIIDIYAQTEMKVYLERLPNDDLREAFKQKILKLLPSEYKKQSDHKVLFPYRRNYIIAYK